MPRALPAAVLPVLLAGCASLGPPPPALPAAGDVYLNVPFFPDTSYYCGPATLASVLNHHGVEVSPAALTKRVYLPGRQGSLTIEMQAAPRSDGLLSYPLRGGIDSLLAELEAGIPVIVLQNLGLRRWPRWHYAVAVGYEAAANRILLHSGVNASQPEPMRRFLNTWRRAEEWALVIVPPGRIPSSAAPLAFLQAAADLESVAGPDAATPAWKAAAARWPEHPVVLTAAGTHLLGQGWPRQATEYFVRALRADPAFVVAWNNLAFALDARGCHHEARTVIDHAVAIAPDDARLAQSAGRLRQPVPLRQQSARRVDCVLPELPMTEN